MTYAFTHEWQRERERLVGLEVFLDPVTIDVLTRLGVGPGWRCAEVGAGGGSIAQWLCERVGSEGRVVATDISTRFLAALDATNLSVIEHDLTADELPGGPFDLLHARAVVEHLGNREELLRRLAASLRPGGWLVIEDFDFSGWYPVTPAPVFESMMKAGIAYMTTVGADPLFGRRLPGLLLDLGMTDVGAQSHGQVITGGSAQSDFFALTIERLRAGAVGAGLITDQQVDAALALCADSSFSVMANPLVSAWGRAALVA